MCGCPYYAAQTRSSSRPTNRKIYLSIRLSPERRLAFFLWKFIPNTSLVYVRNKRILARRCYLSHQTNKHSGPPKCLPVYSCLPRDEANLNAATAALFNIHSFSIISAFRFHYSSQQRREPTFPQTSPHYSRRMGRFEWLPYRMFVRHCIVALI